MVRDAVLRTAPHHEDKRLILRSASDSERVSKDEANR
jgi:hypothetical protein